MQRRTQMFVIAALSLGTVASMAASRASAEPVTVLYDDQVIEVERTLADPNDLWVVPADLPRVNGFELKPEGACLEGRAPVNAGATLRSSLPEPPSAPQGSERRDPT